MPNQTSLCNSLCDFATDIKDSKDFSILIFIRCGQFYGNYRYDYFVFGATTSNKSNRATKHTNK